jgi:hypothetical protein
MQPPTKTTLKPEVSCLQSTDWGEAGTLGQQRRGLVEGVEAGAGREQLGQNAVHIRAAVPEEVAGLQRDNAVRQELHRML